MRPTHVEAPPQHKHKIKHDKTTIQANPSMPGRHTLIKPAYIHIYPGFQVHLQLINNNKIFLFDLLALKRSNIHFFYY